MPKKNQRSKSKANEESKKSRSKSEKSKHSPKKKKSESISNDRYTKFNERLLEEHDHFSQHINKDKANEKRFVCKACKNSALKNFLVIMIILSVI